MKDPLSITQLTFAIKNHLETEFRSLVVQGEISNFKPHSAGHLYFDLKDSGAKVPAVMFKGDRGGLAILPKEGDQVIVSGTLTVYPPHGRYQLLVRKMQMQGVGELLLKFQQLKKKLESFGWFKKEYKKPLPKFPERIGVITSPTGAVIRDMIHVLTRRFSGFHLILNPVRVQGEGAALEIAEAIAQFNAHKLADVLIIGRGGGSLEDLWPFNEEAVAKAIFESQIPIISAVGHETDVSLSDFVADVRAPTPSAAAEVVVSEKKEHLQSLEKYRKAFEQNLKYRIQHTREKLKRFSTHPLFVSPYGLLGSYLQRIDELRTLLHQTMKHRLEKKREELSSFRKGIDQAALSFCLLQRQKVERVGQSLKALNPKGVLKRGYSILFHQKEGSVIVSKRQLTSGTQVKALLSDGEGILIAKESE